MIKCGDIITISLSQYPQKDWGRTYFALILDGPSSYIIYATGETIQECKDNTLKERLKYGDMCEAAWHDFSKRINNCGFDIGVPQTSQSLSKYVIKLCDAKIKIYGDEIGYFPLKYIIDSTTPPSSVRFDRLTRNSPEGGKLGNKNRRY